MGRIKDLTGKRFGRLVVKKFAGVEIIGRKRRSMWVCLCDCGNESTVRGENLQSLHTKSCGCANKGSNIKDLVGRRFGKLVVTKFVLVTKRGHSVWECICDCGKRKNVIGMNIVHGRTQSCGCVRIERAKKAIVGMIAQVTTHGQSRPPTKAYRTWREMRSRCMNPKNKNYRYYGGRGIKICKRWFSFENFFSDMGERPSGLSIERIDNDGNYNLKNCKWATRSEQMKNRRYLGRRKKGGLDAETGNVV